MFFYHPRMTTYDFGPHHPLRPERLHRTMALLRYLSPDLAVHDPGLASVADLERVHTSDYIDVVRRLSLHERVSNDAMERSGFWSGDNPPFEGMYQAAQAYCGGAVMAANHVKSGGRLAFNLAGGLHHARSQQASGFCVFNDCAIACSILRERFDRVAYVDIDLHHGDGVQGIFFDDPHVLTCSIHESGRFLYPGTGFVEETGAEFTSINVPLEPDTTGDTWLWAFENGIMPALDRFQPGAIVLQMGADPHFLDPLGHLAVTAQEWLSAVMLVRNLGLPLVALGGGGYERTTVPRMWVSAVTTLLGQDAPDFLEPGLLDQELVLDSGETSRLGVIVPGGNMLCDDLPEPRERGMSAAENVVDSLRKNVLDRVPRP